MSILDIRTAARTAAFLAVGTLACTASLFTSRGELRAQLGNGDFWLFQPQEEGPVGRAWCNADRTIEYWAYVEGEYEFASPENSPNNPWSLSAEATPSAGYPDYASFKAAVLALPEFKGKAIRFQNHSMVEEVVPN